MLCIKLIPFIWHTLAAPKANAGESNSMKALRRLLSPRGDGSYLIPKEMVEKFKDIHGGGRAEVVRMWEKTGFEKDPIYLAVGIVLDRTIV